MHSFFVVLSGQKVFRFNMTKPKDTQEFDKLLNCDMNRAYKMPLVVGGKGAQREEVFSIINLSLQSFVLFCKTAPTAASFELTKYYVHGLILEHYSQT